MWIMYEKELKEKDTQDSSLTSWSHELDIKQPKEDRDRNIVEMLSDLTVLKK